MNQNAGEAIREEIAIIGMACRFPGAPNTDAFWRNLCEGTVSIGPFRPSELKAAGVDEKTLANPQFVNAGAAIEKADCFDAAFFDYSPVEAEIIDPQQRVLLECAWEALENAGYIPGGTDRRIGVFGGVSPNTYFQNVLMTRRDLLHQIGPQLMRLSNEKDHAMTRISFKLNLKGPSVSVSTACSSSGVALHLACQSLLVGECDLALVGGARISAPLHAGYWYEEGGILSPDGRCRAFDAKANGTVFGEGVGMIVVKRLSEALEDFDTIYAVIKGTAINNDGDGKVGYAAPSIQGQAAAVEEALAIAETHPDTIGYIETHGTGTIIGDPVEIAALTKAFRKWTDRRQFCPIGSVKANIGHLFAAAGIAGIIKTVLALKHRQIPPAAGFDTANPQIDFENSSFYVNEKLFEWQRHNGPRRAAVSSFGVGGTNFHAILEEAPESEPSGEPRDRQLLLISAKSDTALEHASADLVDYLQRHPKLNLADVAYTQSCGRKAFDHRRMVVCKSIGDAAASLKSMDPERVLTCVQPPVHRDIVFMFSGQGSQYVNMAKGLYRCEPVFKQAVDYCVEFLKPILEVDLRDIMYPSEENEEEAARNLNNTLMAQPALFTIEYALAGLWLAWGVRPAAFVGHSIGEYVAACMAGVLSLEDALSLVATRARLMNALPGGQMTAVSLSEKKLEPFLDEDLSISAINGPNLCVVSGKQDAVAKLERILSTKDVMYRRLHTSHAFHSKMMAPIVDTFVAYGRRIRFKPAQTPIVSTVSGTWIAPDEMAQPAYWANNLRRPVRFWDCLQELLKAPDRILLEVGPGTALSTLTKMATTPSTAPVVLSSTRHPSESIDDLAFVLNAIGRIWVVGGHVQWSKFYQDQRRRRISLPTYPFERRRFWVKPQQQNPNRQTANQTAAVKNTDIRQWFYRPACKLRQMPFQSGAKAVFEHGRHWLVFIDDEGLGDALIRQLQEQGQSVTAVMAGRGFSRVRDEAYTIDPCSKSDYSRLLKHVQTEKKAPDTIVHLWSLTSEEPKMALPDALSASLDRGFYSLLFLLQAVDAQLFQKEVSVKIITNQLLDLTGDEPIRPEKATLLGPCRVGPQEYINLQCNCMDIVLPKSKRHQEEMARQLAKELATETTAAVNAYRGRRCWQESFEAVPLGKVAQGNHRLRREGVYLITGGLGGIGLALAQHLAQTVQAKLVLLSRTALPPKDQWPQWLISHSTQDTTSQKIRKIESVEKMGSEVMIQSADISDKDKMRTVIEQIHHRFGKIHGVIHAAGIAGGGMIQLKTREQAAQVISPKVRGALVLDALLDISALDFFVLCSSVISLQGGTGQVDYCAANAFLDALAHQHHARANILSINWCAWQEVGMSVNTKVPDDLKERREHRTKLGISPDEGKEVFSRILAGDLPQVIVSPQDFESMTALHSDKSQIAAPEGGRTTAAPEPLHARPNLHSTFVAPADPTEQTIAEIWAQNLCIEKVGIHDNFFDLGGHSLLVAQIVNQLRSAFQMYLPISCLFESPTVHLLSQTIQAGRNQGPSLLQSADRGKKRKQRRVRRKMAT